VNQGTGSGGCCWDAPPAAGAAVAVAAVAAAAAAAGAAAGGAWPPPPPPRSLSDDPGRAESGAPSASSWRACIMSLVLLRAVFTCKRLPPANGARAQRSRLVLSAVADEDGHGRDGAALCALSTRLSSCPPSPPPGQAQRPPRPPAIQPRRACCLTGGGFACVWWGAREEFGFRLASIFPHKRSSKQRARITVWNCCVRRVFARREEGLKGLTTCVSLQA